MDRRTIITLGIILAVLIGAFSFLIFNSTARQAMQKSLEASTQQAAEEANLKDSSRD